MIEPPRRHGHFDPRYSSPNGRRSQGLPADGGPAFDSWENEGGRYSLTDEPDLGPENGGEPPAGLDWDAFSSRYFRGRRRHDLEALEAYGAYRPSAVASMAPRRNRAAAR